MKTINNQVVKNTGVQHPKACKNPYFLFCQEMKISAKVANKMWQSMSNRDKYFQQAAIDRIRYDLQMDAFLKENFKLEYQSGHKQKDFALDFDENVLILNSIINC